MKTLISETQEVIKREFINHKRPDYSFRSRHSHTLRVLKWAERIQGKEGGNPDIVTMAVLLHDIGWDEERPHNEISYEYALKYLKDKEIDDGLKKQICRAVLNHNQRHLPDGELSLEEKIVMDADIIDEIGIISIVWDSLSTAIQETEYNFYTVLERLQKIENGGYEAREKYLKTKTGLEIYRERVGVFEKAIANYSYELCLSEENPEALHDS